MRSPVSLAVELRADLLLLLIPPSLSISLSPPAPSRRFKCGRAWEALRIVGEYCKRDVLQIYTTPGHGKAASDGLGGWYKHEMDLDTAQADAFIYQDLLLEDLAARAALFGQQRLQAATDNPELAKRSRTKIKERHFIDYKNNLPQKEGDPGFVPNMRFVPNKDSFGVVRNLRDIFCVRYDFTAKKLYFRNIPCSCSPCLDRKWALCENRDFVSAWRPLVLAARNETNKNAASKATELTDEEILDLLALQSRSDELAGQLGAGDVVAVRCTPPQPYWLFKANGPAVLASETFEDEVGTTFTEGTMYLDGNWLERSNNSSSDDGQCYKIGGETQVMSHHIICETKVTAARSRRGRELAALLHHAAEEHACILAHIVEKVASEDIIEASSDEEDEEEGGEEADEEAEEPEVGASDE